MADQTASATAQDLQMLSRLKIRAEEFHRLATCDPLTGLSNRRLGRERLEAEVSRSQRYGHPLSVLLLDLNSFKAITNKTATLRAISCCAPFPIA